MLPQITHKQKAQIARCLAKRRQLQTAIASLAHPSQHLLAAADIFFEDGGKCRIVLHAACSCHAGDLHRSAMQHSTMQSRSHAASGRR